MAAPALQVMLDPRLPPTRKQNFSEDNRDFMTTLSGFHHIRVHAPGATESATVGNNFSCMICGSPLKEDVKFRLLGGEAGWGGVGG